MGKTGLGNSRVSPDYQTKDISNHFILQKNGFYPYPRQLGRKPEPIPDKTETFVLTVQKTYSLGPSLLEGKIEKEYEFHIPHNTIYRILLSHERVKPCMKKQTQSKWVRYERDHPMFTVAGRFEDNLARWPGQMAHRIHG